MRLLLMRVMLLLLLLLWRLQGGEQRVEGGVVEVADHAGEVGCAGAGLLLLGVLLAGAGAGVLAVRVRVAGGWLLLGLLVAVVGRVLRLLRLLSKLRRRLRLLPNHELRGDRRVDVLVELEADAVAARADKQLDGDLALGLGGKVEVDDAVHALGNLALHHGLARESGVDVHDIRAQALVVEGPLDPADKLARHLLQEQNLDVRHVSPEAAGQVEPIAIRRGTAVRAGTAPPVRALAMAVEALGRPRAPASVAAKFAVSMERAVPTPARFVPAGRGGPARPVVVSAPAVAVARVEPLAPMRASWASAVGRPIPLVLFLLGPRYLEICLLVRIGKGRQ